MLRELNKESLLVLYLADELSPQDRSEAERLLAANTDLRLEVQRLGAAMQSFEAEMAGADSYRVANESVVIRRIGKAMRQHAAERALRQEGAAIPAPVGLHYPRWAYPIGAAAAVLIVLLSWWGHRPAQLLVVRPINPLPMVIGPLPGSSDDSKRVSDDAFARLGETNSTQPPTSVASLEAAEEQVAELTRSQSQALPSSFGVIDGNE